MSYAGPFLSNYREDLVEKIWLKKVSICSRTALFFTHSYSAYSMFAQTCIYTQETTNKPYSMQHTCCASRLARKNIKSSGRHHTFTPDPGICACRHSLTESMSCFYDHMPTNKESFSLSIHELAICPSLS